jgi:hypothetical protein
MRSSCLVSGLIAMGLAAPLDAKHPLPGPHFLACELVGQAVHLSWDDLGIGDGSLHAALLRRDGELLAELEPGAAGHDDLAPPPGLRRYELQIVLKETQQVIAARDCEFEVPAGGGIRCEVFGGIAIPPQAFIAWDPLPAELGATRIEVRRDGDLVAELPADALEHSEEPLQGEHRYTVIARLKGAEQLVGSCDLTYEPPVIGGFVRADVNVDEQHDLSDAVRILLYLFSGGPEITCLEAADADDNGAVEITDAVYLLSYLFTGGREPPAPFPRCGHDGTADELSCDVFGPCFTPPPP